MTDKRCRRHPDADVKLELTPELKHYGKWLCSLCGRFVVWSKTPKASEDLAHRQITMLDLMQSGKLSTEQLHVASLLYTVPHLNLIQQKKYDELLLHI